MHTYTAHIIWNRGEQVFLDNRYSRKHVIRFDGGVEMPGSSSPQVVLTPMSDASAVDPEEMFVSSLASCHMLWFLSIAAARKFRVDTYLDQAEGVMEKNGRGNWSCRLSRFGLKFLSQVRVNRPNRNSLPCITKHMRSALSRTLYTLRSHASLGGNVLPNLSLNLTYYSLRPPRASYLKRHNVGQYER